MITQASPTVHDCSQQHDEHTTEFNTPARLQQLKDSDQDFEWYPTTDAIIRAVARDLGGVSYHDPVKSLLDVGAGDGRVLMQLKKLIRDDLRFDLKLMAIEKATPHIQAMPKEIAIVGTDFFQQTLVDKPVGALFCNPPYSQFVAWTLRILREASANRIYLVIPSRWKDNAEIQAAIDDRGGRVTDLGSFDFENAERKARAQVDVIRIQFAHEHRDAFDKVVERMLPELDVFDRTPTPKKEDLEERAKRDLAETGANLVESLVMAYDAELAELIENYRAAVRIDVTILRELGVTKSSIVNGIRDRIDGLKHRYWRVLFEHLDTITKRLATKQRKAFLDSLKDKVNIDFTANNAYAILIWVSKWANDHFDDQLIDLFRTLSTDSSVAKYKSNQRVWTQGDWCYLREDEDNRASHYRLEYRMVISHGGICTNRYEWQREKRKGLSERAFDLLRDVVTVANNLGFDCDDTPGNYHWESNTKNELKLKNGETLVAVRAFQNGNMHMKFNSRFMLAVNVEAGRLLGWIRNPAQAAEEFKATKAEAKDIGNLFGTAFRITSDAGLNLTHQPA